MTMKLYSEESIQDIANAIRSKNGESTQYKVGEMAQAILDIPSGVGGYSANDFMSKAISGDITLTGTYTTNRYAMNGFTNITNVFVPGNVYFEEYALSGCTGLKKISGTFALGSYSLKGCTNLEYIISKPGRQCDIWNQTCSGDTKLKAVDIWSSDTVSGIRGTSAFFSCTSLTVLVIRKPSVYTLNNVNNFAGSPFASNGAGGTLYVPQSLISAYQSATNWSTILGYTNNQILPIEGSIYETQYADGTPIE